MYILEGVSISNTTFEQEYVVFLNFPKNAYLRISKTEHTPKERPSASSSVEIQTTRKGKRILTTTSHNVMFHRFNSASRYDQSNEPKKTYFHGWLNTSDAEQFERQTHLRVPLEEFHAIDVRDDRSSKRDAKRSGKNTSVTT